jgi:hypothetical protein
MKNVLLFLTILSLSVSYSFSQSFHTIEDFDNGSGGFTSSGNASQQWTLTTDYARSAPNSFLGKVPTTSGYSIILESPEYDLTDYDFVYLHFDHICKVSMDDTIRIEYSEEMNGVWSAWQTLPAYSYTGSASRYMPNMAFNEASYSQWDANVNSTPNNNTWWKHESFDLQSVVGGANTKFRFVLKKGPNPTTFTRYGWLIDNFELIGEVFEIKAPTVEFINSVTDTITTTGPFDINAKVKTNTSYPIQQPYLVYTSSFGNDPDQTVSVAMRNMGGDSLWRATIPSFVVGTSVAYFIIGEDARGNTDTIKENYYIKNPVTDSNSVALESFDAPLQWQVQAEVPIGIDITIRNIGIKNLDSVFVSWTLNGDTMDDVTWKPAYNSLPWDFTDSIRVGSYTPRANQYDTIVVWISMPNGKTDPNLIANRQITRILYGCTGGLAGPYIVGPNQPEYKNLGVIFTKIRNCHLADDIVIKLEDTIITTTLTISNLKDFVYDKTITITSLSGNREDVVLKPESGVAIALSNVNNLIFDEISIEKTTTTDGIEFSNTCENITINNCKIKTGGGYGINASTWPTSSLNTFTLKNSLIDGASTAARMQGTAANRHKNITIDSNEFINTTGTSLSIQACLINSISYNTITAHPTSGSSWKGIYISNTPKGGKVVGNKIYSVNNVSTAKIGIEITSSPIDSLFLANNEIHLSCPGTSTSNGIRFNGVTNSQCLHNTVLLTGSGVLRAFSWEGTNSNILMQNNHFIANGTNSSTLAFYTASAYAYSSTHRIDYNNYYSSATLASVSNVARATLPELQAVITSDIHSINQYPDFLDSVEDLRLNNYDPFYCPVLSDVPTDKIDNPRVGTTSIGCYGAIYQANAQLMEILNWTPEPMTGNTDSIYVVIRNGGSSTLTAASISYTMNGSTTQRTWSGSIATDETATIFLGRITYQKRYNDLMVCLNSLTPTDNLSMDDTLRLRNYGCSGALAAGIYTVGSSSSDDFADLDEVALHLTQCGVNGAVTINFPNGTYVQNTSIGIIPGSSTTNTVTISSASGNRNNVTFQRSDNGLSMRAPVMLNGASNIIFKNVSFSGVSPHVDPSYSFAYALIINSPSRNITIDNCHLYIPDGVGTSNDNHIVIKAASVSSDIHITNSLIEGGFTGVRISGQANTARTNNISITNNIISKVDGYGIYLNYANGDILQNTITQRNGDFDQANNLIGIYSQASRGNIIGNRISAVALSAGIYTLNFNTSGQRGLISNNEIIGNIKNNASYKSGIYLTNTSSEPSYANVYHNSIFIEGTYSAGSTSPIVGIYVSTPSTSVSIKNNSFITIPIATAVHYPIYIAANTGLNWDINGNNYYSQTGVIGYMQGETIMNMAAWKRFIYRDLTSVSMYPRFFDPAKDLTVLDYTGFTAALLSQVSDDINNAVRSNPTTIGAYQYEYKNNDANVYELVEPVGAVETGVPVTAKITIQNLGLDTLKNVMIGYKLGGQLIATQSWTGALAQEEYSGAITLSTTFTPEEGMNYLTVYTYSPNGQTDGFTYNDTLIFEIYACNGGPISGTFTINPNGNEDFETFAEAVNILTNCGISAPVTINVDPGIYEEEVVLGTIPGTSDINTVTFVSTGTASDVSIIGEKIALTLTDVSHVYFKNISMFGKEKAIVFEKTCNDIEFRECNIVTDTVGTTTTYRCIFYNNTSGSGERLYNVRLINNLIKGGYNNIYFSYPGSDNSNMGYLIIDSNIMDKAYAATTSNSAAVYITGFTHLESFSNNVVTTRSAATAQRGVILQNLWITGKMDANKIVVNSTSGTSYVLQLVNVNNGSEFYDTYGNALITNNEIIKSSLTGGTGSGVRFETTNADFFHNSVYFKMFSGGNGYALQIYTIDRSLRLKNNIFVAHGSATYATLPVTFSASNRIYRSRDAGVELDYNSYYNINGNTLAQLSDYQNVERSGGTFSIAALRAITMQDEHSNTTQPTFISDVEPYNLKLSSAVGFQAPVLPGVPNDFNGNARLQPTYMGAHDGVSEIIPDASVVSFIGFDEAIADGTAYPVSVVIGNNGNTIINPSDASLSYTVNGTSFTVSVPQKTLTYNQFDTISLGSHSFNAGKDTLSATIALSGDINQTNDAITVSRNMCNEVISGIYTAGTSASNFSNFDAFWTRAQSCEIGGDVTLQFETGTYSGAMNLSNWNTISNGHTLTITSRKQDQDSVIFTYTANLLTLSNTSNIVLDNITLDASTTGNVVQFSGDASNITIANSKLMANPTDTSNTNICIYKGTTGILDGLMIKNCIINGGHTAIGLSGQDHIYVRNIEIDGNTISNQAARGIYGNYSRLWKITNNKITARSSSMTTSSWTGISLNTSRENVIIEANRIFAGNNAISESLLGIQTSNLYVGSVINNDIYLNGNASLMRGIEINTPKEVDYLHNSVFVTGTGGATSFTALYLNVGTSSYSTSIYNNILVAEGAGNTFAVYLDGSNLTPNLLSYYRINSNIYYSSVYLGYVSGAVCPSFETWKFVASHDVNSLNVRPPFMDANQDLRIETVYDFLTDRLAEVAKDKDGIVRNPSTARGAYEFNYANVDASLTQFVDITVPEINQDMDISVELINLGTTPLLSATVKWSLNGVLQDSTTWSGNLGITQKETVFLGKAPLIWGRNDIEAWVSTAYDISNGNDTVEMVVYPCSGAMSGTFTIGGQTPDFATVDDAITALGLCGISGPVVLELASGTYSDIIMLNSIPGMSTTNTITFTSATRNPNNVVIATNLIGVLLRDVSHLRFENLTIDATNGSKGFQILSACENIEIRNCRILLPTTSVTGVHAGISKEGTTGTAHNIRIVNNTINGGYYGIHFNGGTSAADYGTDIIIDSNIITNNHYEGIRVLYSDLPSLSYNKVEAANNTSFNRWSGIYLENVNGVVNANRILQHSLISQPRGLSLKNMNSDSDVGLISNNEIIITAAASTTIAFYAMYAESNVVADIVNNSILVNGTNSVGIGLYIAATSIKGDIKNNILTTLTSNYPIYVTSSTSNIGTVMTNLNINYNNYHSTSGNIGYIAGAVQTNLANWIAYATTDVNSTIINPSFINPSANLELSDYASFYTPRHAKVGTDINDKARTTYTTKGAYGLTIREGYDLELASIVVGSGNEQDLCKEDYVSVKYIVRNGGNFAYDFAVDSMDLHFAMTSPDGLLDFDTVITIKTGELDVFLTDTFEIKSNLNVSIAGNYQITAWLTVAKDMVYSNDTARTVYQMNKIKLPFDDNFSTNSLENIRIESLYDTEGLWKVVQRGYDNIIQPVFGSGKLVFDDPDGSFSMITIGQLELNRTVDPKLEFWYAHDNSNPTHDDLTDVKIHFNGKDSTLQTIRRYNANYSQPTWVNYTFDLSYFQNASCVTVYFVSTSRGTSQHIDRIAITSNQDIAVKEIQTSALTACDLKNQKLNVILSNETNQDFDFDLPQNQATVQVEIKLDGIAQPTLTLPVSGFLAGLSTITVSTDFDYIPGEYDITTSLQISTSDANPANNLKDTTIFINPKLGIRIHKLSENGPASGEFKHQQAVTIRNAGNMNISGDIGLILMVDTNNKEYFTTTKKVNLNLSPKDSIPIMFDSTYIVPWIRNYEVEVYGYLICDSATINATDSKLEEVNMDDLYILNIINPLSNGTPDKVGDSIAVSVEIKNRNIGAVYNNEVNVGVLITDMNRTPIQEFSEEVPHIGKDVITYDFNGKYAVPALSQYLLIVYIENKDDYIYNDTMVMIRNTDKVSISNPTAVSFTMEQNIPNPAKDKTVINYNIPKDGEVNFHVYSASGQLLYSQKENATSGNNQIELNISDYAAGIYFYTMEYKGQHLSRRMSIE